MINEKFGKLTIIEYVGSNHYGKIWKCKCDCGQYNNVVYSKLKNGSIKSCGCSKKHEDISGKKYGLLLVIKEIRKEIKEIIWLCKCDCGNETKVRGCHLKNGHTKSCGCLNKKRIREINRLDLLNDKYGRLIPIKIDERISEIKKKVVWLCQCDCGNEVLVAVGDLRNNNTKSCGCLRNEMKKENHPRWNKNVSLQERETGKRKYNTDDHKKWRKMIFERDKYTCQISGQKGGQLVAHHIKSWDKNKNLRFDITNGITISRKLHIKFHKQYGYGNNNDNQLKEFINENLTNKKIK